MKKPWGTEDQHEAKGVISDPGSDPGMAWLRVPEVELKMIKEIAFGKAEDKGRKEQ